MVFLLDVPHEIRKAAWMFTVRHRVRPPQSRFRPVAQPWQQCGPAALPCNGTFYTEDMGTPDLNATRERSDLWPIIWTAGGSCWLVIAVLGLLYILALQRHDAAER